MPDAHPLVIAVDGPAASGKGTLARRLAAHFGLPHLDTGMLYRAVAAHMLGEDADPADAGAASQAARELAFGALDSEALRDERVGQAASVLAKHSSVRAALLGYQRDFAARRPGAVLDGRDIGTVVCPDAKAKIFLAASPAARGARRVKELRTRGVKSIESRVLHELKERDARDSERDVAPLMPAADAFVIETTDLTPDEVFERASSFVVSRVG